MDKTYGISDVADKLGLSAKTLRRWEESGKFRSSRTLGNQRRYSLEDLQILDAIKHGIVDSKSELLTDMQAAQLFGVSTATVNRWENEGKIHPLVTAGTTYFPRKRLLDKMDELKQENLDYTQLSQMSAPPEQVSPSYETPTPQPLKNISLTKTSLESKPRFSVATATALLINLGVTMVTLGIYHSLFTPTLSPKTPESTTPTVLPSPSTPKPLSIIDKLVFTPSSSPTGTPGTLYFDAGTKSLRLYTNTWIDLTSPPIDLSPKDTKLIAASDLILKGKSQVSVKNQAISRATPISVTMLADYAPAKKYWLEVTQGSFTLHTDFPVGSDVPFSYLILAAPDATGSATTF